MADEQRAIECRAMAALEIERRDLGEDESYMVSGYATTFDHPYELWQGVFEQVDRHAIDGETDVSDVIMLYDHSGKVVARTSNSTLKLKCDEHGLFVEADLSKSMEARSLYEEIDNGLVTQMSFSFTVDCVEWDERWELRTIKHISKIYDVSAVGIPANSATEIHARSASVIEAERRGAANSSKAKAMARLRLVG